MKKQANEIAEQAMKMRDKLSWENEKEKKYIGKVDYVIRGTKAVKFVFIAMSIGVIIAGVYIFFLLSEAMGLTAIPYILVGCAVFYGFIIAVLKLQLMLYQRTMTKVTTELGH